MPHSVLSPGSQGDSSLGYQLKKGKKSASTRPSVNPQSPLFPPGTGRKNASSGERRIHMGYLGTTQHS